MEEDSRDDFLTRFREFFEEMFNSSDLDYPLPVQVAKYNIKEYELKGEIISWCNEFLMARKCDPHLAAILGTETLKETLQAIKENRESYGYRPNNRYYSSLQLMQMTIKHLVAVCSNYRDNAKLSTLSPPSDSAQGDYPLASTYSIKNTRRKMEDRHVAIRDLNALYNLKDCGPASYYAVFDGHNGAEAAAYCSSHVHQFLVESPFYNSCPQLAFADAFQLTDSRFIDKSTDETVDSGTTVLCALIRTEPKCLYVAWLGDSQAVLVSEGKYSQLVLPHRPDNKEERDRINDLGGTVMHVDTWRVNGQLAVSRAIGDAKHKPFVSSDPDVRIVPLTGKEEFLIMASDGLWDFVSEEEAVESVYKYLKEHSGQTDGVAKHLVGLAKNQYSRDNISVLVVFLSEPDPRTIAGVAGGDMSVTREVDVAGELWRRQSPMPTLDCLSPVNNDFNCTDSDKLCMAKALVNQAHTMEKWAQPASLGKEQIEMLSKLPWNCRPNPLSYADAVKLSPPKSVNDVQKDEDGDKPENKDESTLGEIIENTVGQELSDVLSKAVEIEKTDACEKKEEETNNDVVETEADSGEESEEEWNYISGKNKQHPSEANQQIPSDDDMSQLNPNAAEFVPVLPSLEPVLASSPAKGSEKNLDNVKVPSKKKFLKDISSRPSDLDDTFEYGSGNDSTLNGDDLTGVSTKAQFGDDSFSIDTSAGETEEVKPVNESEKLDSTNPFADDFTQHELVENHFEAPTTTPVEMNNKADEVKVDNLLSMDSDFAHQSEKPDLLSPIENQHHVSSNEQQTSSSGFDSESGNEEPDYAASDKCDLIADVPVTNEKPLVDMSNSNPFFTENAADEGAPLSEDDEIVPSVPSKTVEFNFAAEESPFEAQISSSVTQELPTMTDLIQEVEMCERTKPSEPEIAPEFHFTDIPHVDLLVESSETPQTFDFTDCLISTEMERLPVFNFSDSIAKFDESPLVQEEEKPCEPPVQNLLKVEQVEQGAESESFELINPSEEDCDSMKGIQNLQEDHEEPASVEITESKLVQDLPPLQESSVDDIVNDFIVENDKLAEEAKVEELRIVKEEVQASAPPRTPSPVAELGTVVEEVTVEEMVSPPDELKKMDAPTLEFKPVSEPVVVYDIVNDLVNNTALVVEDVPAPLVDSVVNLDTPPSTPAAEATEDSGLVAAAIGTAGIAVVAGAAAVLSSEKKKEEEKPASNKPSPIRRPPSANAVGSKKPEPASKTASSKTITAAKPATGKPSTATSTTSAVKRTTATTTTASKPLVSRTAAPATKSASAKPTTPTTASKPSTPTSKTALGAKPTTTAAKTTASPTKTAAKPAGAAPLKTSTTATAAKPRVGATATAKPTTTATKPAVSTVAKKPDLTKPAPARSSTVSSRPTSATSTTSRPSSATTRAAPIKPPTTATRPPTTTTAARPAPLKTTTAAASAKPAAAKPATTALKSTTAAKVPAARPAVTAKTTAAAPAKSKPAAPTVVKKPGAADKLSKDTVNNKLSSTGKLVANSKKPSLEVKSGKCSPEKIEPPIVKNGDEPATQEPLVTTTTTNGHLDNGVESIETSVYSAGIIESH